MNETSHLECNFLGAEISIDKIAYINSLVIKDWYILYFAFLGLGFGKFIFYIPLFLVYFCLKSDRILDIKLNKSYLVLSFLLIGATLPLYIFGYNRIELDNPLRSLAPVLFTIIFAGFAFQYHRKNVQIKLVVFYLIGIGLDALVVSIYSYRVDPSIYGYGRLIDPFSGIVINSPSTGNNLALFSGLLILSFFYSKSFWLKTTAFLVLLVCILSAFFLGGRTYFIILLISTFLATAINSSLISFVKIIFIVSLVVASVTFFVGSTELLDGDLALALNRLAMGLESTRFQHYTHGLSIMLEYPFGGFEVDKTIENTKWFHNIFLDNARLAGWIPVISLFASMFYVTFGAIKSRHSNMSFSFIIFLVAILIMQQDVVIEGNFRMLMVMYLSGLLIVVEYSNDDFIANKSAIKHAVN